MANKSNNKNIIIGVCAAVAVIAIIVVAIIFIMKGNQPVDESYFVSDSTKLVMTLDSNDVSIDDPEYNPVKTHLVYYYSGDEITGLKAYYQYADANAAAKAADYFKTSYPSDEFENITAEGNYVVMTAKPSEYEDMTATDAKEQIDFMESLKNMDVDVDINADELEEETEVEIGE